MALQRQQAFLLLFGILVNYAALNIAKTRGYMKVSIWLSKTVNKKTKKAELLQIKLEGYNQFYSYFSENIRNCMVQ